MQNIDQQCIERLHDLLHAEAAHHNIQTTPTNHKEKTNIRDKRITMLENNFKRLEANLASVVIGINQFKEMIKSNNEIEQTTSSTTTTDNITPQ